MENRKLKDNPNYSQFFQNGLEALAEGSFPGFESKYRQNATNEIERILGHLYVKDLMSKNLNKAAITFIKKTRAMYGDHIMLISDLAALYYLTGQYALWAETLVEFEATLVQQRKNLTSETYIKCMLILAKFQEEQGAISKSYATLLLIEKCEEPGLKLRIQANLLRLDVFYGRLKNLNYYSKIKQAIKSDLGFNTLPEVVHAVALAEVEMLEAHKIEKNLIKVFESTLPQEDKLLMLFDVALLLSLKKIPFSQGLLELLKEARPEVLLEDKIKTYIFNIKEFNVDWDQWSEEMPLGHFFHLSRLLTNTLAADEQAVLNKQILLLTKGLPPVDQSYWRGFLVGNERLEIKLDQIEYNISIGEIKISLKNKKNLFEVMNVLVGVESISLEDVTLKLFESEYNESYYHRIRRLVKRLNDEFENCMLPAALKCGKTHLGLSDRYFPPK
jgi:hypothetical protein